MDQLSLLVLQETSLIREVLQNLILLAPRPQFKIPLMIGGPIVVIESSNVFRRFETLVAIVLVLHPRHQSDVSTVPLFGCFVDVVAHRVLVKTISQYPVNVLIAILDLDRNEILVPELLPLLVVLKAGILH